MSGTAWDRQHERGLCRIGNIHNAEPTGAIGDNRNLQRRVHSNIGSIALERNLAEQHRHLKVGYIYNGETVISRRHISDPLRAVRQRASKYDRLSAALQWEIGNDARSGDKGRVSKKTLLQNREIAHSGDEIARTCRVYAKNMGFCWSEPVGANGVRVRRQHHSWNVSIYSRSRACKNG